IQMLHRALSATQKSLQKEQAKANYILSSMSEGFVLLDKQKNILLCNNSAQEFFACPNQPETIYNLTRHKKLLTAIDNAGSGGQSSILDVKLTRHAKVYVRPSRAAGNTSGVTMLLVDMTAEKELETKKRDFFTNASHELKTPITSIIGFSEMLNQNLIKGEDEKKAAMQRIEAEAKRMSGLINDILTISRLESDGKRNLAQFDFSDVAREAIDALAPQAVGIEINADLTPLICRADKRQLYDLCVNLIENAVKYNKPNGDVFVSAAKKGGNLVFTVKDTGIGIPAEYQTRIFERFFRVDEMRQIAGTGLGLSIVKHIVGSYNGNISLQSCNNAGTEIVVMLPLL
ncbi:MAG: PAS domain-containing sensor histidine kinase, partial [Oscillospiraceae bacterium]|nr:PAS domain-containing sensor histidine kinase [Oscillospiraceae bacterium]